MYQIHQSSRNCKRKHEHVNYVIERIQSFHWIRSRRTIYNLEEFCFGFIVVTCVDK